MISIQKTPALIKNQEPGLVEKLINSIFLSLFVAPLPIYFRLFEEFINGGKISFNNVCGDSELLIVSAALAADAIGKTLGSEDDVNKIVRVGKTVCSRLCIILLSSASALYAYISSGDDIALNVHIYAVLSFGMFVLTVLVSGVCAWLAEISVLTQRASQPDNDNSSS
jgi:hypothetical protein